MKVLVVNQHANNFGDEAAGAALVENLLDIPEITKIELLYCMPGFVPVDDPRVIHNHELNIRKATRKELFLYYTLGKRTEFIDRFVAKVREYDKVIVSPCGANLGIYKDWGLLLQDLIIARMKKPLIFHLNTINESGDRLFDHLVLRLCKMRNVSVNVREHASLDYLTSHGIHAKFGTDSAFSLNHVYPDNTNSPNVIAFVPSDVWSWHVNFINNKTIDFERNILDPVADFACEHGCSINILPHTNSPKEKTFNTGIVDYFNAVHPDINISILQLDSAYQYEEQIRNSTFLIGMRYHSTVFAIKNAVPFCALSYENKMREVSAYSHQLSCCLPLEALTTPNVLADKLAEIWSRRTEISNQLQQIHSELVTSSQVVVRNEFHEE